jgi:hypothetical protein
MPQRRVLFLDATHLTACHPGGGKLVQEGRFAADTAGLEDFSAYLASHRSSIFMLLADVPEEGFQLEEIPRSRGKDRTALLQRKLSQHFYGTPFTLAFAQGCLKTGRRDERLLLMALTQPQHFEPWLNVLRKSNTILAGIYSLPQIVPQLLTADAPAQLLLITRTCGGLRQSYFTDRQLRFSRLTPLASPSAEGYAIAVALEVGKMHQYLASQRLLAHDQALVTRVLAHPAGIAAMREHCRNSQELRFEFADLLQEAQRLGLDLFCTDSCAEPLFCHLLERKPPAGQFAPPAERKHYRLWQTRFVLKSAAAIILAASLLFAAQQGVQILKLQGDIDRIRQTTLLDQHAYDDTLRALPKIPLTTDNLRALVDRHDQVVRRAPGPAPLLIQLSRSLDVFPNISIDQIDWQIIEQIESAAPVLPSMANGPYAQASVVARLPINMAGDKRGQLALVAAFAKHLGQVPDTQVTILQPPIDTQSGKTLKSSDESSTPEAPRFSFRLTRKL